MPIYAYLCGGCGKEFEAMRTVAERDEKTACSHCGSEEGQRVYKPFGVSMGASGRGEPSCPSAGSCPHSEGCGCH